MHSLDAYPPDETPLRSNTEMHRILEKGVAIPYYYLIETSENKRIYYVGTPHTYDQADPAFTIVKDQFKDFMTYQPGSNKVVFVEGWNTGVGNTEKDTIERYGEPGYARYLAHENNIEWTQGEPLQKYIYAELLKSFTKEEIMLYQLSRAVVLGHNLKLNVDEYINTQINEIRKIVDWPDFDFSLENLKSLYEKYHHKKFDENDYDLFYQLYLPSDNNVSGMFGKIRDVYMVKKINAYLSKQYNIFIVYGAGHAIIQEPALKALQKK